MGGATILGIRENLFSKRLDISKPVFSSGRTIPSRFLIGCARLFLSSDITAECEGGGVLQGDLGIRPNAPGRDKVLKIKRNCYIRHLKELNPIKLNIRLAKMYARLFSVHCSHRYRNNLHYMSWPRNLK